MSSSYSGSASVSQARLRKGTVWDPVQLVFVVPPAFGLPVTWLALVRAKRHLVGHVSSDTPLVEYEGYEKQLTLNATEGDPGLQAQLKDLLRAATELRPF